MTEEKYKKLIQAAVPSKEVRDYCEKIGRNFVPYELAVLICQNTLLSYSQKLVCIMCLMTIQYMALMLD